jgi:hypothetical protein
LATAPIELGIESLLGMSGRVYRQDQQRRADEAKANIITNAQHRPKPVCIQ